MITVENEALDCTVKLISLEKLFVLNNQANTFEISRSKSSSEKLET